MNSSAFVTTFGCQVFQFQKILGIWKFRNNGFETWFLRRFVWHSYFATVTLLFFARIFVSDL